MNNAHAVLNILCRKHKLQRVRCITCWHDWHILRVIQHLPVGLRPRIWTLQLPVLPSPLTQRLRPRCLAYRCRRSYPTTAHTSSGTIPRRKGTVTPLNWCYPSSTSPPASNGLTRSSPAATRPLAPLLRPLMNHRRSGHHMWPPEHAGG